MIFGKKNFLSFSPLFLFLFLNSTVFSILILHVDLLLDLVSKATNQRSKTT